MSRYDYHRQSIGDTYYKNRPKKKKSRLTRSLFLIIVFAFIIALFVYVFPEVEVSVVPETETVEDNFIVTVDKNVKIADFNKNIFPGEVITVDKEMKKIFATTGEKNIGDKAQGQVVFFNQTGLVQPLTTENGLVTDDGVVFFLKHNIEIPKAEVSAEGNIVYGNMTADIIAKQAGEEGNVGPGRLTIIDLPFSKQNKIYGEIKSKLNGGTSKVIRVVSQQDLDEAEKKITEELAPKLRQMLEEEVGPAQVINDDLIEYETLSVEKAVELDEEIDEFIMKLKARARALVWDTGKVQSLVMEKIRDRIPGNKKLVASSQDVFRVEVEEFNLASGTATLKVHTKNQISLPIDPELFKDEIKGLNEFEARRLLLAKDNVKDVRFKFRYSLASKIPKNRNRINVKLNF